MLIPLPCPISNRYKRSHRHVVAHHHLMLAGISQTVIFNQWGGPEIQIGLNPLGSFYKLGPLFLVVDPTDEVHHSIWIYKKRDRILFFTKKRLTFHFKWSEFKEILRRPKEERDFRLIKTPPVFMATTLALVA